MKSIIYMLLISIIFSCGSKKCSEILGFQLDYYLFKDININNKRYCQLVEEALNGNKESVVMLTKINIGDGGSYQHGAVLLEVIDHIGVQKYLDIISYLSTEERKKLYYTIWAGFEYTSNPKFKGKDIQKVFPSLKDVLVKDGK